MGDGSQRLPIRGGNWNNGANAGVFALNLNNLRTNVNTNIGFRVALAPQVRSRATTVTRTVHGAKGTHLPTEPCASRGRRKSQLPQSQLVGGKSRRTVAHAAFYFERRSMKRIGNIYGKICSFENLYQAYLEARKNKRYRHEVLRFSANLEENLLQLQRELLDGTYQIGEYHKFIISEPKKRLIMALQFRDRVVQWAVYRQLNPIFDKQYISDSFACRKGKGTHKALDRLGYWLKQTHRKPGEWYCLKMDITKYFYRVDHETLIQILRRKIKDKDVLRLLEGIVNSEQEAFGLPLDADIAQSPEGERLTECGMPIGNLTSQMFANLYLNELDQFVKHELREHYYIRYMDDMLILGDSKKHLQETLRRIEEFLGTRLKLTLNRKTSIRPVRCGIEFVGFRVWPTHRKLRKSSAKKLKRGLARIQKAYAAGKITFEDAKPSIMSYFGVFRHFDSHNLATKVSETFVLQRASPTAAG